MPCLFESKSSEYVFQAFIMLLDKTPYPLITASDVIKRSGVSRGTFYRYFSDVEDILKQFFEDSEKYKSFSIELEDGETSADSKVVINYNISYIIKHSNAIKVLLKDRYIYNIIVNGVRDRIKQIVYPYREVLDEHDYAFLRCKLIYQISGYLTLINDWLAMKRIESADELIGIINTLLRETKPAPGKYPNIVLRIIRENYSDLNIKLI